MGIDWVLRFIYMSYVIFYFFVFFFTSTLFGGFSSSDKGGKGVYPGGWLLYISYSLGYLSYLYKGF